MGLSETKKRKIYRRFPLSAPSPIDESITDQRVLKLLCDSRSLVGDAALGWASLMGFSVLDGGGDVQADEASFENS